MRKFFRNLFIPLVAVLPLTVPLQAAADTISVSQIITITATVAPARSIVVNDQGQMIKIYSNTSENVQPNVYLNKAPGPKQSLTPELQKQYATIMARPGSKVGVAINVPLPVRPMLDGRLGKLLSTTVSLLSRPTFFNW